MFSIYSTRFSKHLAIVFLLFLLAVPSLFAKQHYSLGLSFVDVPTFKAGLGSTLEYSSTPDFRGARPPATMTYGARVDFAVTGYEIEGMILSMMTGGGVKVSANEHLSVSFYSGPSFIFFLGNAKNGNVEGDSGLGVGVAGNIAYAFTDPGFVLKLGAWANCPLVLTNKRPFSFGVDLSVGVVY